MPIWEIRVKLNKTDILSETTFETFYSYDDEKEQEIKWKDTSTLNTDGFNWEW